MKHYIGRFAPSPTGPLHFGSLVTAVASYFQAKQKNGHWLVRIEDVDKQRTQKGASDLILKTLEAHHLYWDHDIVFQSTRQDYYYQEIKKLHKLEILYRCQCSRKTIQQDIKQFRYLNTKNNATIYPGTCRYKNHPKEQPHTLRVLVPNRTIHFYDTVQKNQSHKFNSDGDFIIQRTDGSVSYQLAVAIDDAAQKITEVVRGVDLIDSTSKQILLLTLLDYPIPEYCHLPIVCNKDGSKLSKQTGANALDNTKASSQLWLALSYLKQQPPDMLKNANIQELHSWALQNWDMSKISRKHNSLIYQ